MLSTQTRHFVFILFANRKCTEAHKVTPVLKADNNSPQSTC